MARQSLEFVLSYKSGVLKVHKFPDKSKKSAGHRGLYSNTQSEMVKLNLAHQTDGLTKI